MKAIRANPAYAPHARRHIEAMVATKWPGRTASQFFGEFDVISDPLVPSDVIYLCGANGSPTHVIKIIPEGAHP